jgi:lipoprotein-anchoring transpeptidase ErfK/SrfK
LTNQKTQLGGGIGFHGWASEWNGSENARLSWGCVVMHNPDIRRVFDDIPLGAMVVLL